ncbi:hypothetical protein [Neptuniibacter sp. QD34_54]|uniref:hypothetical protein n=1 Tax=Neptuniibacter sp. QD34_54 TaxID=3398208 RepID=UPI0039F4A5BE
MCTPGKQVADALCRLGTDSYNSNTTPQQSQFINAFDRIVNNLSAHPISDGYFWDSVSRTESQIGWKNSFQEAIRHPEFRKFAARHPKEKIYENILSSVGRKFGSMSIDHKETVSQFLLKKSEDSLGGQLAWETKHQALRMMQQAISALENLVASPSELQRWQQNIIDLLYSEYPEQQKAGKQFMDGLGIQSRTHLSNISNMAQSISATTILIVETKADFNNMAPQNLYRTIAQVPGAQESLLRTFQANSSSFTAHCLNEASAWGDFLLSVDVWTRAAAGIFAGVAIGIVTAGAGTLVGFAAGAATSGLMGAPGLIIATEAIEAARVGEASGTMGDQAIENAESSLFLTQTLYVAGILIPNGVGAYISHTAKSIATGAGLSFILEYIGTMSVGDQNSPAVTKLREKLESMTPVKRDEMSTAFHQVLEDKAIPQPARVPVMASFAEAKPASLDKTVAKAALDLATYCDSLERQ